MKRLAVGSLLSAGATLLTFAVVFIGCWLRGQSFVQVFGFPFGWPIIALVFLGAWFYSLLARALDATA